MVVTLGQQYHVGEKPTVILCTYINRHAGTPNKTKTKDTMSVDYSSICYIGSSIGEVSMKALRMVITYSESMDQPGKVANPARGQLNRENEYFPVRVRA